MDAKEKEESNSQKKAKEKESNSHKEGQENNFNAIIIFFLLFISREWIDMESLKVHCVVTLQSRVYHDTQATLSQPVVYKPESTGYN